MKHAAPWGGGVWGTGKGKVVPVHIIKAYMGKGGTAPLIPNLNTRWK
jgi:hypothetical protein